MEKGEISKMNIKQLLAIATLIFASAIFWQLRWVILVFFGALVIAVALDVLIENHQSKIRISRHLALTFVLLLLFQSLIPFDF